MRNVSPRRARPGRRPHRALRLTWTVSSVTVSAVLTAAVVAGVLVPRLTGATPYVVLTGSMEPALPPGTLVVDRPVAAGDVAVGDVVTYQLVSGEPAVVTHRVVAVGVGVVGLLGVGGTFASWTDSVTVGGTSVTGGTLDLRINGADSYASTTLSMPVMVPGSSSAEVVTVKNNGTAKLRYAVVGSLTGADATAYSDSGSLRVSISKDGTRSGTGSTATCTGGTLLGTSTPLTVAGATVSPLRGPLASGATESLCVQVTLALDAPSLLQGRTAGVVLSATATTEP